MQRCYCGHSGGSYAGSILKSRCHISRPQEQQQPSPPSRSDLFSMTSSSRQSTQPTQFIKRTQVNQEMGQGLGLGHSSSGVNRDFSRRNSAATTVSHCSSCCSSSGGCVSQRESRVKVLTWERGGGGGGGEKMLGNCQHTDKRRFYEQRACAASQGQGRVQSAESTATCSSSSSAASPLPQDGRHDELQRLLDLQQFRLSNASDCFSIRRQDELRLQRAYDKMDVADNDKRQKDKANAIRQQSKTLSEATTPYALRQRLLQLQLREEKANGRGSGAVCAPLQPSCALRFNCQ